LKVVVAMSGGVDSSVAAALLKEAGHDVIGATMQITLPPDKLEDARIAAGKLDIPHHIINLGDIFAREVIAPFCQEYLQGRTPNPCIRCNRYIKFGALLDKAEQLGADFIATGHHARIERDNISGRHLLKKGVDRRKDQSYFLYTLTQEQLNHTLLPVGSFKKDRIRKIAGELGLSSAAKADSQEICFIPNDDYPEFLKNHASQTVVPGPILDKDGNVLGEHEGIQFYTIGQRKGLGIAAGEPRYVISINPEQNAIVVGSKAETFSLELTASVLNWISIANLEGPITAKAKIRYQHRETEAEIIPLTGNEVYVKFAEPQMAITPGQAVVFYHGDTVIGGGTIDRINYNWINNNGERR